jgi:hypothetical protein
MLHQQTQPGSNDFTRSMAYELLSGPHWNQRTHKRHSYVEEVMRSVSVNPSRTLLVCYLIIWLDQASMTLPRLMAYEILIITLNSHFIEDISIHKVFTTRLFNLLPSPLVKVRSLGCPILCAGLETRSSCAWPRAGPPARSGVAKLRKSCQFTASTPMTMTRRPSARPRRPQEQRQWRGNNRGLAPNAHKSLWWDID